ncbi:MAG: hypothetical protein HBSIN02_01010 [Bacteroidia bacterium]|nr:MAG: hypothetical protein HBSIN02_01010 [Bacteroidia bacterium]
MDFVLWASRVMHILSAAVWAGGLIFMNAVLHPVFRHQGAMPSPSSVALQRRFFPFLWSSLWTMLATGVFMAVLNPRFLGLSVSTLWTQLLAAKVFLFLLILFTSWQAARVVRRIEDSLGDAEAAHAWEHTLETLIRRSIALGILTVLCAGGMAVA